MKIPCPAVRLLIASFALCLLHLGSFAGERARITVLSTTDLHGNLLPEDPFTRRPDQRGLAKLATLIQRARKDNPKALLLDVGDTIQGSPLEYYHARRHPESVDPIMLVMNQLRYDSMTVGNHEYNFGPEVREKARSEAAFPWLSANTVFTSTGEPAYTPFLIKEVDGVRVAILGITTPGVPYWEDAQKIAGLSFLNPIETTRLRVAELREKYKADIVVAAMHMGLEEDLASSAKALDFIPFESTALAVARSIPGVDLILLGHTHRNIPALVVNNVLIAQAGRWGDRLVRADLYVEKSEQGRWSVIGREATTLPVTEELAADPAVLALAEPYERETRAWLDKAIGQCAESLDARESRLHDTAIMDLIQLVQLEAGKADVSFAASFSPSARIPAGKVTVRDVFSLYVYDNTLVVIEATGLQIKQALEHAARYFKPWQPGATPEQLMDPKIPGYNFDMAAGVSYTIDLTRPPGDRIRDLRYKGAPLDPGLKLRVSINNYRYNGGGGYTMFKACPVLQKSSEELRTLIIEWIERHGEIPVRPDDNWRLSTNGEPAAPAGKPAR
jgi:2',3'-cyclic-nucleotide 2'-phosphodiesterase/3'-nucleotidase